MRTLVQDLRYAARLLMRSPAFTVAAIVTLALGIGANATIFSLTDAVFFRRLAVPDADRIVHVFQRRLDGGDSDRGVSLGDYEYYRQHAASFEALAAHYPTAPLHVVVDGDPVSVSGAVATASYFDVLGLRPAAGRFFSAAEDEVRGRDAVAVISHEFWRRRFDASPAAVGRSVSINGRAFTIVGVAPAGFNGVHHLMSMTQVWIPSAMFGLGYRYCDAFARDCRVVHLIGRMREGVSAAVAQEELDVLARQLAQAYPASNKDFGAAVVEARGDGFGHDPEAVLVVSLIMAGVALVLLIGCANITSLLLARAIRRRREIAVRLSLGASRVRLIRQLLTESVLLAVLGGALGLLVAVWGTDLLEAMQSHDYAGRPLNSTLTLSGPVVLSTIGLSLTTALVFGLAPAFQAVRTDLVPALKEYGGAAARSRGRLATAIVIGQIAMSTVLLVCAGLLVQTARNVYRGPGFDPRPVVTMRLRPSLIDYSYDRATAYQREVVRRLESLPGVISAAPAENLVLAGGGATVRLTTDASGSDGSGTLSVSTVRVGPRYFSTLGVRILQGREFDDRDRTGAPRVTIANDVLARRLCPDRPCIGRSVFLGGEPHEIVGVVKDERYYNAGDSPLPSAYLSYWQPKPGDAFGKDARLLVRVSGSAASMMSVIRRETAAVDPMVPISEDYPLLDRIAFTFGRVRMIRTLMVTMSSMALLLSAVGLYGMLAFAVTQRTREMAIRMALGADRAGVRRLVVRDGLRVGLAGVAVGLVGAWLAARLLAGQLYGLESHDLPTFAAASAILLLVALAASYLPARRATSVSPLSALRYE